MDRQYLCCLGPGSPTLLRETHVKWVGDDLRQNRLSTDDLKVLLHEEDCRTEGSAPLEVPGRKAGDHQDVGRPYLGGLRPLDGHGLKDTCRGDDMVLS